MGCMFFVGKHPLFCKAARQSAGPYGYKKSCTDDVMKLRVNRI